MFIKSKDYGNYIHTHRIDLGDEFGKEKEEVFITLREMDTKSVLKLKNGASEDSEGKTLEVFREILPNLIVDHNFYETEDKKMSSDEVADLLFEKIGAVGRVLTELQKVNFFH